VQKREYDIDFCYAIGFVADWFENFRLENQCLTIKNKTPLLKLTLFIIFARINFSYGRKRKKRARPARNAGNYFAIGSPAFCR
jgi:hypothetical protein